MCAGQHSIGDTDSKSLAGLGTSIKRDERITALRGESLRGAFFAKNSLNYRGLEKEKNEENL